MKLRYLPFVVLVLLLNACMWGVPGKTTPAISKDTLAYTYQTILNQIPGCSNKTDSECDIVKIKYPVFVGQKSLNDTICRSLINGYSVIENKDTTLKQLAEQFIKANEDNKDSGGFHDYNGNFGAAVIRQDPGIITLKIEGYTFQGGARGYFLTYFLNWDIHENKKLILDHIFIGGYQDKLNRIADTIFRKNEKLTDTSSLAKNYFFEHNKFALNDNFLITPEGLHFLYNEYEIKPSAAGQTNLLIPYNKLKSLLLPNTVVSQYIK